MRRTLIVLAAMAALTACSSQSDSQVEPSPTASTSSTPTPPPPPPPAPRTPKVGECYRLSLDAAAQPTSDATPTDCSGHHTARTLAVGQVKDLVKQHVAVDAPIVQTRLARLCPAQLHDFLGGSEETRRLARLTTVWFTPTLTDASLGAAWYRCDVIAFGDSAQLLRLPSDQRLKGALDRAAALATYGTCGTSAPGTAGFTRVACSLKHSWRALSTIDLTFGRRYPGASALKAAGDDTCASRVRSAQGQPLKFSYGWEWPSKDQWATGQHYGFCWAPD